MRFASAVALVASLTAGLPLSSRYDANTIQVVIKTGDGDASIQITVTLDQLFTTPQQAVAASIFDPTAVCQAFSDSAGTSPLGEPFTAAKGVIFVNDGSVDSVASDAITVGAFLCSNSSPSPPSSPATVIIQLEQSADQFVQGTVPADGSIFLTADTNFGTLGLGFSLVKAEGADLDKIKCQAFYDAQATIVAGTFATEANGGVVLTTDRANPVTLNAFKCTVDA
jgi:hypothetical protein